MDRWATFDCYGTLIDWNGGIAAELARVFGDAVSDDPVAGDPVSGDPVSGEEDEARSSAAAAAKLAEYHVVERELERDGTLSYREVMTEAMRRLGASDDEAGGLADSLPSWEPFPEVRDALSELRERGWKLAILSNSDLDLIEASKSLIGVPFEETVVASQIRSYKPALAHWMEFYGRTLAEPSQARPRRGERLPRHRARRTAAAPERLDQPPWRASRDDADARAPGPRRASRHPRRAAALLRARAQRCDGAGAGGRSGSSAVQPVAGPRV